MDPLVSNLKDFRLQFLSVDAESTGDALSTLGCPQLENFNLEQAVADDDEIPRFLPESSLRSFLATCSKILTRLMLTDVWLETDVFLRVLACLPQLETLHVQDDHPEPYFTIEASKRLSGCGNTSSHQLLPLLKSITIRLDNGNSLHFSHYAELVLSRRLPSTSSCTLKMVEFSIADISFPAADISEWSAFAFDGLSVTLIDEGGIVDIHGDDYGMDPFHLYYGHFH